MKSKQKRPKFLNLFAIHLPVTGVNSIAHRISGALLFLSIPGFIYLFGNSIHHPKTYVWVLSLFNTVWMKVVLTLLAWAAMHHLLAGIRFLLTDMALGTELKTARATAWAVNIAGVVGFVAAGYRIWL